jgi:hypothetical protein
MFQIEKAQIPLRKLKLMYRNIPFLSNYEGFLKKYSRIGADHAKATDQTFNSLNEVSDYIDNLQEIV